MTAVPEECLAAIGAVTVEFALLEEQIELAICMSLGLTKLEHA
jgi:hypothetical protein